MADRGGEYPAVFVVDSRAGIPPLPPRPGRQPARRNGSLAQTVLFLLVVVALCGVAVEACLIYRLYVTPQNANHQEPQKEARKDVSDEPQQHGYMIGSKTRPPTVLKPDKPLAHLTAGNEKPDKSGVVLWHAAEADMQQLEYRKGALLVLKEGYYYVYSKVCFSVNDGMFHYSVMRNTSRYMGGPLKLLRYRTYQKKGSMGNGYLGGVFHLLKGDGVFIQVKNTSSPLFQDPEDNFFGMFML